LEKAGASMNVLITGGAGFVGSYLARGLKDLYPSSKIVAFDNLRRRGSEFNVAEFKRRGIHFVHGDIRNRSDLLDINENFDLFIEASAEPSVHSGSDGRADYLVSTNLLGTVNCLEFARVHAPRMIFLSTSRVYSLEALKNLPLTEEPTRLSVRTSSSGVSEMGIAETFECMKPRSLYGATKLASEILIHDYADTFKLKTMINRCGVIAGPGQWGKTDQGVFTLWVVNHHFKKSLRYTGFGGEGKQVRDLLHPQDLLDLLLLQNESLDRGAIETYNLGGGLKGSVSLQEMTKICEDVTGNQIEIGSNKETAAVDVPWYISDNSKIIRDFGFEPKRTPRYIVEEISQWINKNEAQLKEFFQ